ncbi:MAG: hypothetical protein AAGF84_04070 [Planctomycetota bacterium]
MVAKWDRRHWRASEKTRWLSRGFWALLDQGLFAGTNFLLHVLLARMLSESSYGSFASAYAIFLLMGVVHTSFLTEPMMVFGPGRFRRRLGTYLSWLINRHVKLSVLFGLALFGAGCVLWAVGLRSNAHVIFAFAIAQGFILLPWMLRNACYIEGNPKPAAMSGAIYLLSVMGGVFLLWASDGLNVVSAVLLMGVGSVLAGIFLIAVLRIPISAPTRQAQGSVKTRRHWNYGRWAVATNLIRYMPEQLPYLLLPLLLTYADAGAFKAIANLTVPFVLVIVSVSVLALPVLVREINEPRFHRLFFWLGVAMVVPPLLCWPFLGLVGPWTVEYLYDGKYVDQAGLLWIIAAILPIGALGHVLEMAFKASERSDRVFACAAAACATLLATSVPLTLNFGLYGMASSVFFAYMTQSCVAWILFVRAGYMTSQSNVSDATRISHKHE